MNTTIELFKAKRLYKYLWCKEVSAVTLGVHCARCLVGNYNTAFHGGIMAEIRNVVLPESKWYYICGVSSDRNWSHNLHIAFVYAAGQEIIIDDEFCTCHIMNARRLDISTKYIDWSLPQSRRKEFSTCRNWQFANMVAKGLTPSYSREEPKYKQLNMFEI